MFDVFLTKPVGVNENLGVERHQRGGWTRKGKQTLFGGLIISQDMQDAFGREAEQTGKEKLLLTMAVSGGSYYINLAYEPKKIVRWAIFRLSNKHINLWKYLLNFQNIGSQNFNVCNFCDYRNKYLTKSHISVEVIILITLPFIHAVTPRNLLSFARGRHYGEYMLHQVNVNYIIRLSNTGRMEFT